MARKDAPWADAPDRFDKADREWSAKWADRSPDADGDLEAFAPPSGEYQSQRATPGGVHDAYTAGMRAGGSHLGMGLQIGVSMVFFVGLGILVDRWLDSSPWGVILGAVLGMVGIMALVLRMAREGSGTRNQETGRRPSDS